MMEKRILITGSTDGIGKETARQLAARGHHIILHGRDREKGEMVRGEISRESGNENISLVIGDLSSQQELHSISDELHHSFESLDVLIHNAGTFQEERTLTADGIEMTFAVNHMAPFILTKNLYDMLKLGNDARIITVSSMIHSREINFENIQGEQFYDGTNAYCLSKLCNILFTYKLAELIKHDGISANCLHPGVIDTKLLRKTWSGTGAPVAEGAKTSVYLADSPEVENMTGSYFVDMKPEKSSAVSYSSEIQNRLWNISETLIMPRL
ncbi:MAG TPA: SDR family oxidoreductase [Spirochaetota bacterium]|nr:SDR family oxidoreductase [Spirochaetota bacterium]HQO01632.1 SDR family oxidoreductase [Spirochaetota bacterium]HQP49793.1 SDR family oxidoreductase [Spirochaetota bacterium]